MSQIILVLQVDTMDNVRIIKVANEEQKKNVQTKVMPLWNSKVFITSDVNHEKLNTLDDRKTSMLEGVQSIKSTDLKAKSHNIKRSRSEITEKVEVIFHSRPQERIFLYQVLQLQKQCENLEEELDDIKCEIVKMISEKVEYMKENVRLKTSQLSYEELEKENEILRSKVEEKGKAIETKTPEVCHSKDELSSVEKEIFKETSNEKNERIK